jgi:hypothetical protein
MTAAVKAAYSSPVHGETLTNYEACLEEVRLKTESLFPNWEISSLYGEHELFPEFEIEWQND